MAPIRIIFFLLALVSLLVCGSLVSHALDAHRDYHEELARADKAMKALDAFEFDENGNVPANKRREFETAQRDLEDATLFSRSSNAERSFGVTYGGLAGATTVLLLVLGVAIGRKKKTAPPAGAQHPRA